ncbi:MAG: sigma-54 dependent transcriptional regulator [Planctomycetota bacterium]
MTIERILVVDDDPLSREFLGEAVRSLGWSCETIASPLRALERVAGGSIDLVLTDLRMPEMNGLELVRRIEEVQPGLPIVLVTAHGSVQSAVEALQAGARDFLLKPVTPEALRVVIERVARADRLVHENEYLRSRQSESAPQIVARSPRILQTLRSAARVAHSRGTVLITGESGTGKERIAQFIHENSPRKDGPFVRVNCAALSESLLESELFGHEKGAFTGAHRRREGRFELADGGTLLLDEIGEISPSVQAKLLRVLEENEFERVGGDRTLSVDVRVVAATNRNLPEEVARGRFREDLYYRLHVLPIHLDPLRERPEDVVPLAEHFVRHFAKQGGLNPAPELGDDARDALLSWSWPGNVRELENVVQRAVVLSRGGTLHREDFALGVEGPRGALPSRSEERAQVGPDYAPEALANRKLADIERDAILATLDETGGNKTEAARRLGVTARTLSNKMKLWKQLGLVA